MTLFEEPHYLKEYGSYIYMPQPNIICRQLEAGDDLHRLCRQLKRRRFRLLTGVACDEREHLSRCFTLRWFFVGERVWLAKPEQTLAEEEKQRKTGTKHPGADGKQKNEDLVILYLLFRLAENSDEYPTIHDVYPTAKPFEAEHLSLMGLKATHAAANGKRQESLKRGSLPASFPPNLHPLRREQTTEDIRKKIQQHHRQAPQASWPGPFKQEDDAALQVPVGPIHAGIIEPGRFVFEVMGDDIEYVHIRLGYTHKGIERLMQTHFTLENGWRAAQEVCGDAGVAHALAYCRAVEKLAPKTQIPATALAWRVILLELERIHNHVNDLAALLHDIAMNRLADELAAVRERLLRQNQDWFGSRFLRDLIRPGGVFFPAGIPPHPDFLVAPLKEFQAWFRALCVDPVRAGGLRNRMRNTGLLTKREARERGATGFLARASGLHRYDHRYHPDSGLPAGLLKGIEEDEVKKGKYEGLHAGDVFARFLLRIFEVNTSVALIGRMLCQDMDGPFHVPFHHNPLHMLHADLGIAESWRGDVVYWVKQDNMGRIFRCKIRDPSMLHWPVLKHVLKPKFRLENPNQPDSPPKVKTLTELTEEEKKLVSEKKIQPDFVQLSDFPLINKSFNLSYAGNDL